MTQPDPWTSFLEWLGSLMVPDWNAIIGMLPLLMVLGVVGPILTLLMVYWLLYFIRRRRGHVRFNEQAPIVAPIGAEGLPVFPPNTAYCDQHAVIYPGDTRRCEIDGQELSVRCPVDGTVRPASLQLCRACGTRYVLGASQTALVVRRAGRPPEGGSAIA